jgi:hypothetical protein
VNSCVPVTSGTTRDARIIDSKRIDEVLSPRTLEALVAKYLDQEITDAHDAMSDVRWTAAVVAAQLDLFPNLPQTVEGLHALLFPPDPTRVDKAGKLTWRHGEVTLTFGEHNGRTLKELIARCACRGRHVRGCTKGFLEWMLTKDFPEDTKRIVRDALAGRFPHASRAGGRMSVPLCLRCGHDAALHTGRGLQNLVCEHFCADGPCFCAGYVPCDHALTTRAVRNGVVVKTCVCGHGAGGRMTAAALKRAVRGLADTDSVDLITHRLPRSVGSQAPVLPGVSAAWSYGTRLTARLSAAPCARCVTS